MIRMSWPRIVGHWINQDRAERVFPVEPPVEIESDSWYPAPLYLGLQRIEPFHHIGHVDCLCVGVHQRSRFGPFAGADRSLR